MNAGSFQVARWTLFAGFAVMVLVVTLPNPEPSLSWQISENDRYLKRFPELRNRKPFSQPASPNHLAGEPDNEPKRASGEQGDIPRFRTAQLPSQREAGKPSPGIEKFQEPVILPEDEEHAKPSAGPNVAPRFNP